MHDIGRTQQEYLGEAQEFQPEAFEFGGAGEVYGETLGESFEGGWQETGNFEAYESQESPLNEAQEMELASELLEVSTEEELDRFLGKLISSVGRGIGRIAGSPLGRALGGFLKPLAKKFLPIATGALGTFLGGPLGGVAASQLGNLASRAFGLELEGMSSEDAQFEVARRFVRFASSAVNSAAAAPPTADPRTAAQVAVTTAAQRHAPGLLRGGAVSVATPVDPTMPGLSSPPGTQAPCQCHHTRRKGVWIRRGRRILLLGV
jgi:hypothetical protein